MLHLKSFLIINCLRLVDLSLECMIKIRKWPWCEALPRTTRKDLIAFGQLRKNKKMLKNTRTVVWEMTLSQTASGLHTFFLFFFSHCNYKYYLRLNPFFDNLIASTGLLQQQRREPCAGHTLASVSLCRLTSLSVGSRRVTEGGSHHNHCRGCELGGETQTSAVVFFEETGLMLTSLWRMREQVILIHSLEVAARNCFLF